MVNSIAKYEDSNLKERVALIAIRALARSALHGNEAALTVLKESKGELKKWAWLPEVKELFEKNLI